MRSLLRKGMSEMMAIVIGIVITIAVGALLWSLIPSLLSSQTYSARMSVEAQAFTTPNSTVILVTVRNLGQKELHNVSVERIFIGQDVAIITTATNSNPRIDTLSILPSNLVKCDPITIEKLEPGKDASIICTITKSYDVGTKVVVIVTSSEGVRAKASTFVVS